MRAESTLINLEIDDPLTWPQSLLVSIDRIIAEYPKFTKIRYSEEIKLREIDRAHMMDILETCPIVVYHLTRCLPHEVASIRQVGLLPLSTDLINTRINSAYESGDLGLKEANLLREAALKHLRRRNRIPPVDLMASRNALKRRAGAAPLLNNWGGEAMYGDFTNSIEMSECLSIGQPYIIKGYVYRNSPWIRLLHWDLPAYLVAVRGGKNPVGGNILVKYLPPEHILQIISKNDSEWETIDPMSYPPRLS